jgi:hypothetical protein
MCFGLSGMYVIDLMLFTVSGSNILVIQGESWIILELSGDTGGQC